MQNKAIILHQQASPKRSMALADSMIATCGGDPREDMRSKVAEAMYNKAVAYDHQNQYVPAMETYRQVIETYGRDASIETRRTVVVSTVNLVVDQERNRLLPEAVATFQQLISAYANDTDGEIREQRAWAMFGLGSVQQEGGRLEEAVASFDQLIGSYTTASGKVYKNIVMQALDREARAYLSLNRPEDGGRVSMQLVKAYAPGSTPEERLLVAQAGLRLGKILLAGHQTAAAVKLCDDLAGTYSGDAGTEMREVVAESLQTKALAVQESSPDDALVIFEQVARTYGADRTARISWTVGYSLNAAAYKRLLIAKRDWRDKGRAQAQLRVAQEEITASLARIPGRSWTLGNLAYVQWLLGDQAAAMQSFASALADPKNGGATIYKDTLDDIARFPIREDAGFRRMVDAAWMKYGAGHPGQG